MKIFLIGPGGVGKTTCGAILANLLGYSFIDLDREFIKRIENVDNYITAYGHEKYRFMNSKLFYTILSQHSQNLVFSLSSGFLVHEDMNKLTSKHAQTLKELGVSILLLPSESLNKSMEIVVARQLSRGFGLTEDREKEKFTKRFPIYKNHGDIRIFSHERPEIIAEKIKNEIEIYNKKFE